MYIPIYMELQKFEVFLPIIIWSKTLYTNLGFNNKFQILQDSIIEKNGRELMIKWQKNHKWTNKSVSKIISC